MNAPQMLEPQLAAADTHIFTAYLPVPSYGAIPVNAFLILGVEPVLVDAGVIALGDAYFEQIAAAIDLQDLRWIWLTHVDPDHLGCLERLLDAAPQARVITTFLGMGKLGLFKPLPPERVYLLNPGQLLDVGDRQLLAVRPAVFDAPETTGLFDLRTRALFCADCFGAILSKPAQSAAEIPPAELRDGLLAWSSLDCPWLSRVEERRFQVSLDGMLELAPSVVLSSHLPPARHLTETLAASLAQARLAEPVVGPDQQALVQMMTAA